MLGSARVSQGFIVNNFKYGAKTFYLSAHESYTPMLCLYFNVSTFLLDWKAQVLINQKGKETLGER